VPIFAWIRTLFYLIFTGAKGSNKKSDEETTESRAERARLTSNVPLSLSTHLQGYVASLTRRGLCEGVILGQVMGALDGLQYVSDTLTKLLLTCALQ